MTNKKQDPTTKDFNLSEERKVDIISRNGYTQEIGFYPEIKVKEFIRLLKEEISKQVHRSIQFYPLQKDIIIDGSNYCIDKLAGDKLT